MSDTTEVAASTEIATLPAVTVPAAARPSTRTGEPRRPVVVGVASALFYLGATLAAAGLLASMYLCIDDFAGAARLFGVMRTEPGSLWRVLFVALAAIAAVLVIGTAAVTAYYTWAGYAWTKWAGAVAFAVSGLTWLLHPLTPVAMIPIGVAAGLLWLPAVAAFDARWDARRHPAPDAGRTVDAVFYGPLPRFAPPAD